MRWGVDGKGAVTHTIGAPTTCEPIAAVTCEAGTVALSRLDLLTASIFTAAAIILFKDKQRH